MDDEIPRANEEPCVVILESQTSAKKKKLRNRCKKIERRQLDDSITAPRATTRASLLNNRKKAGSRKLDDSLSVFRSTYRASRVEPVNDLVVQPELPQPVPIAPLIIVPKVSSLNATAKQFVPVGFVSGATYDIGTPGQYESFGQPSVPHHEQYFTHDPYFNEFQGYPPIDLQNYEYPNENYVDMNGVCCDQRY